MCGANKQTTVLLQAVILTVQCSMIVCFGIHTIIVLHLSLKEGRKKKKNLKCVTSKIPTWHLIATIPVNDESAKVERTKGGVQMIKNQSADIRAEQWYGDNHPTPKLFLSLWVTF